MPRIASLVGPCLAKVLPASESHTTGALWVLQNGSAWYVLYRIWFAHVSMIIYVYNFWSLSSCFYNMCIFLVGISNTYGIFIHMHSWLMHKWRSGAGSSFTQSVQSEPNQSPQRRAARNAKPRMVPATRMVRRRSGRLQRMVHQTDFINVIYIYIHTYVTYVTYVYMCMCVLCVVYVGVYKYIYTYIYIYTYMYTFIYIFTIHTYVCDI